MRRVAGPLVFVAIAALAPSACGGPDASPFASLDRPPRNLIVIVIDTLRRDHVGAYGYARPITPTIDALAAAGVRADGIAPTSWTKPSTASLLTGLHPIRHQAFGRNDGVPAQVDTLAELLKARGYSTGAGVSSNGWISETYGFEQGFGTFLYTTDAGFTADRVTADDVTREVMRQLPALTAPFFLYVHYVDPHLPYRPAITWQGESALDALGEPARVTKDDLDPLNVRPRTPALVQRAVDLYDGEIRVADRAIGNLLGALRRDGRLDDTLVVVTSDHGEEFVEHERMGHGHTLYRETTEVPLVFYAPQSFAGGRAIGAMSLMDVVPTVLDLMGMPPARGLGPWDGISLAESVARGAPVPQRDRLLHLDFDDGHAMAYLGTRDKVLLSRYPYAKELYDLAADPNERANLFGRDAARSMAVAMPMVERHNALWRSALTRRVVEAPSDALDAIRALGYVGQTGGGEIRRIPSDIVAPDALPDGRLGWEDTARPCVSVADPVTDSQLLAGWHRLSGSLDGRWTEPHASLLVGPASTRGTAEILVAGINHRPAPFELRISVDGRQIFAGPIARGPFRTVAHIGPLRDPAVVRLDATPPFRPSDSGSADARVLGAYVQQVCVRRSK